MKKIFLLVVVGAFLSGCGEKECEMRSCTEYIYENYVPVNWSEPDLYCEDGLRGTEIENVYNRVVEEESADLLRVRVLICEE